MSDKAKDRAAKAAQLKAEHERAEKRQRNIITAIVVVVVVALIGVAFYAVRTASDANTAEYVAPANMTKDFGFLVTPEDVDAKSDNPVAVVLYEDMQCPACAAFSAATTEFWNEKLNEGSITLEYRIVSFLDSQSSNQYSSRAANAVACVWDADGSEMFKPYQEMLFASQPSEGGPGPENEALGEAALSVGASAAVLPCINDGTFAPWVEKAYEAFTNSEHTGTPTIVIDGKTVTGADGTLPSHEDLQKAIDAARK